MRRVSAAGARKNFSSLVKKSQAGERIKVMRYNKTAAVLIPKRDLDRLEDCEEEDEKKQDEPAAAASGKRGR
jgi:prevent-host-death family protein